MHQNGMIDLGKWTGKEGEVEGGKGREQEKERERERERELTVS